MRMPREAPFDVPIRMASGVASPRAQGQAMTMTETAFMTARETGAPWYSHPRNVSRAMRRTAGTK